MNIEGLNITDRGHYVSIEVTQEAARSSALATLREELTQSEDSDPPLVMDFGAYAVLPSVVLGDLVLLRNALGPHGRRILLIGLEPDVQRMFCLTKIDKLFEMHDTLESALTTIK